MAAALLASAGVARADKVYLKDGTVREGTVTKEDDQQLWLRTNRDGIKATVIIKRDTIEEIKPSPPETAPEPKVESKTQPATEPALDFPATPATTQAVVKTTTRPAATQPSRFFQEFFALAAGLRPDISDPTTLSAEGQAVWAKVVAAHEVKPLAPGEVAPPKKAEALLAALTDLLNLLEQRPARLDALTLRYVNKPFARWLAEARWDVVSSPQHMRGGVFNLKDVTEFERTELIGVMRGHTRAALDPLRPYLPQPEPYVKPVPPPKTGKPAPVPPKADPLAGINVGNALEVRDRALFAIALLQAQKKIEPEMSAGDKTFVTQQLAEIGRVLQKANVYAPAAQAAKDRAKRNGG